MEDVTVSGVILNATGWVHYTLYTIHHILPGMPRRAEPTMKNEPDLRRGGQRNE